MSVYPLAHYGHMFSRLAQFFGVAARAEGGAPAGVVPPARRAGAGVGSPRAAMALDSVYRAVSVIQTAGKQLGLDAWRGADQLEGKDLPVVVAAPGPDLSVSALVAETIASLALRGNAYWLVGRTPDGRANALRVLDPLECVPVVDRASGARRTQWRGRTWEPDAIRHLRLVYLPGEAEGLGPIQACARALGGAAAMSEYASAWTTGAGVPTGVLSTDQPITAAQASEAKARWNESNSQGGGVAVIGNGLHYAPLHLKPSEIQFLESRAFDVLAVGRMFGVPAHMLLASLTGSSMTYQNINDASTDFIRWTLMAYLREIEDALTAVVPRGTTVRFNLDAILRATPAQRMATHATAIQAGVYTPAYARKIEGITDPAAEGATNAQE